MVTWFCKKTQEIWCHKPMIFLSAEFMDTRQSPQVENSEHKKLNNAFRLRTEQKHGANIRALYALAKPKPTQWENLHFGWNFDPTFAAAEAPPPFKTWGLFFFQVTDLCFPFFELWRYIGFSKRLQEAGDVLRKGRLMHPKIRHCILTLRRRDVPYLLNKYHPTQHVLECYCAKW